MSTQALISLDGRRHGLSADNQLITAGRPFSATFTPATDGANVTKITIQIVDSDDKAYAAVVPMDVFLSDAATGVGLTAVTASGAVNAKSGAGGADLGTLTTKKALRVQTDATGKYVLSITDTAKTGFYPCVNFGSKLIVGAVLVTGNYG